MDPFPPTGSTPTDVPTPPRPDGSGPPFPPPGGPPPPGDTAWVEPIPSRRAPRAVAVLVAIAVILSTLAGLLVLIEHVFAGPAGNSDEYRFLVADPTTGGPKVRWNPCEPIHYVVNAGAAPPGSIEDVHEAVSRASVASGIEFSYDGLSEETPTRERNAYQLARYGQRWAPVVIAWVDPSQTDIPFSRQGHEAAAVAAPQTPPDGQDVFVSGWIAMNVQDPNPTGFDAPGDQGPVLLHELGHILGLNHVNAQGEVMEPSGGFVTDYGAGDLEGLRLLGSGGCLSTPSPG